MIERIDRQRGDVPEVGLSEELLKVNLKDWTKKMITENFTPVLTTVGFRGIAGLEKQIEWIEAHSCSH